MTKRINATVSDELYNFTESVNKGNRSYVVKMSIECLRQLLTLSGGDWQTWLEQAQQALREQVPYLGEENESK